MLEAKNLTILTGGIVAEPEIIKDKLVKLRIAVNFAGSEVGVQGASGYFDVSYWLNDDNKNVTFVRSQLDNRNMKKGSQISVVGRLVQERWSTEGGDKRSRVTIVAESISYAGSSSGEGTTAATTDTSPAIKAPLDF